MNTRTISLFAAATLAMLAWLSPVQALAEWPESAFTARNTNDAMGNLFGTADNTPSNKISITAPAKAKDGSNIPITVETRMAASAIAIVVEKNPKPLSIHFQFSGSAKGYLEANLVLCKTTDIIAVVKSGGKLYTARHNVRLKKEGCNVDGSGTPKERKSIRADTKLLEGDAEVRARISHPMGAQHITEFAATHNGWAVLTVQMGPFIPAKPVVAFRFAGAKKGDMVNLAWTDRQGRSDSREAKVK